MSERTIEVHRVQGASESAQRTYQIITRRQRLDGQVASEWGITVTEREAIDLINQLVREMVGGDDE